MAEEAVPVAPTGAGAKPAQPSTVQVKDPKLAAALKKSQSGQTLNPDEQKLVAGAAMMQAESRLRRVMTRLNESEVQQAQVVLAAQDMVDKMQGMLEDVDVVDFAVYVVCLPVISVMFHPTLYECVGYSC